MATSESSLSDASTATQAYTLSHLAMRLTQSVGWFTVASAVLGVGSWWVLFGGWPTYAVLQFLAFVFGIALLLPAAILALFYQGLRDLVALPKRIRDQLDADKEAAKQASSAVLPDGKKQRKRGRLWRFVKGLWALRKAITDSKGLLIRYGAMIRFVNPWSIVVVLIATGVTFLMGALVVVGGALRLLLG